MIIFDGIIILCIHNVRLKKYFKITFVFIDIISDSLFLSITQILILV